jgi:hypothetical protein
MTGTAIESVRRTARVLINAKLYAEDVHVALEFDNVLFFGGVVNKRRCPPGMSLATDAFLILTRGDKAQSGNAMPVAVMPHAGWIKHFVHAAVRQHARVYQS